MGNVADVTDCQLFWDLSLHALFSEWTDQLPLVAFPSLAVSVTSFSLLCTNSRALGDMLVEQNQCPMCLYSSENCETHMSYS